MKIIVGSDHAGFELKEKLKQHLTEAGYEVEDIGTDTAESVDYPEFAKAVAKRISSGEYTRGILACGSGVGMAIAANRFPGVRAAAVYSAELAELSRQHNDSNVLSLGERMTTPEQAIEIVDKWLETPFEGGRHERRVIKIDS